MSNMRPIYLDNAATTPVDREVAALMAECLTMDGEFGNPSSASHRYGAVASARVEAARAEVAASVGAAPREVIWTSGATEADNLAIFGTAHYYRDSGRHLVTSRTEHKAVLDPIRELERGGWQTTYLEPDARGLIHPEQVAAALRPDTVLVSIMQVNNEIGVMQDIAGIAGICRSHGARLHVDAAQSLGKCAIHFDEWGIDLLSLSAHKAYGPKGAGALVMARGADGSGVQLRALQFGGGQERNIRPGTIATHQVVGMGRAASLAAAALDSERIRVGALRERLWMGLAAIGGVIRNGDAERSVPQILNVSFEGVEGESLMASVQSRIAVSSGSACSSAAAQPSYVLRALGRDDVLCESSLRLSLGRLTTEADIDAAIEVIARAVPRLRQLNPTRA
jgi:cysteine desulfurase